MRDHHLLVSRFCFSHFQWLLLFLLFLFRLLLFPSLPFLLPSNIFVILNTGWIVALGLFDNIKSITHFTFTSLWSQDIQDDAGKYSSFITKCGFHLIPWGSETRGDIYTFL